MTVGLVSLWIAYRIFGRDLFAWGLGAVVAYMFRDRIKDIGMAIARELLPKWVSDRDGRLVDPQTDRRIGLTRESFRWIRQSRLPKDIVSARQYPDSLERLVSEPTDRIIHYRKEVNINTRAIYAAHKRAAAIDDILRLSVGRWLAHLDNPRKSILYIEEKTDKVRRTRSGSCLSCSPRCKGLVVPGKAGYAEARKIGAQQARN